MEHLYIYYQVDCYLGREDFVPERGFNWLRYDEALDGGLSVGDSREDESLARSILLANRSVVEATVIASTDPSLIGSVEIREPHRLTFEDIIYGRYERVMVEKVSSSLLR